jgi:predicted nicotinamide N-methyase
VVIMAGMARDQQIIRTGTRLGPVPLVPEIRLYQASDPISLWQRTEAASGRTGLDPPFWAFAWAAGQALARYLLDHPRLVRGRDVIDIASGSGLVAIAAAMAGAAAVTAYDIDPLATEAIEANAAANSVTVRAVCADVLDRDDLPPPGAGLVLVADAFYQRDLAARVIRFAERGQARGAAVLAADFGRAYLPRDRLTPLASYDVPGQRATEDSDTKHTTIWSLTERPAEIAPAPPESTPDVTGTQADVTGTQADVTGTNPVTPLEPRPS